eukprot:13445_1
MLLSKTASQKSLTNSTAVQLLKELFAPKNKSATQSVLRDAFNIYNSIGGDRNYAAVNTLLRLYLHYNYPQNVLLIWNDIEHVHRNLEYDILIQCCSKINDSIMFDIDKGIQTLQWIKHNQYLNPDLSTQKRKNYSIFVNKVLSNCQTLQQLQDIHTLTDDTQDIFIQTTLIHNYHTFGRIDDAFAIFESISKDRRDIVCINGMMNGLLNHNQQHKALLLYDEYHKHQSARDNHMFYIIAIKCCIKNNDFIKGKYIHDAIKPSLCNNAMLATTLIDFYGYFGDCVSIRKIFNAINHNKKDRVMVTSMMKCLVHNQCEEEALEMYDAFAEFHDSMLHSFAIKACININDKSKGMLVIDEVLKQKHIQHKDMVYSTLIEFYGHFGQIDDAVHTFNSLPNDTNSVICVGALIKALINNNRNDDALSIYKRFEHLTDDKSHVLAIKACTNINDLQFANNIMDKHYQKPESCSIEVVTTLIDCYGHFGDTKQAHHIFKSIPDNVKTSACYNAMMNAFCDSEWNTECIELFTRIKTHKRLKPNSLSYTIALKACTQATLLHAGMDIHEHLRDYSSDLLFDIPILICLIGMYGKCGQLDACKAIVNEFKRADFKQYRSEIRVWNAMIHAFGRNGDIKDAMKTYYIMTDGIGLIADYKTFIVLLNSCSHSGEVALAQNVWQNEINEEMKTQVVAAYIDCISRKEYLQEAYALALEYDECTRQNKENDNKMMWMSLLSGCTKCKNIGLAQSVYNEIEQRYGKSLKHKDLMSAASQLLSNMFS